MPARIGMLKDDEIIADMNATLVHMKSIKDPAVGPVGIVGFCMGGRVSYLMAAANKEIKASAVFYGGNILKQWGSLPLSIPAHTGHQLSRDRLLRE